MDVYSVASGLSDGAWDALPEKVVEDLGRWVRQGGTLVATERAPVRYTEKPLLAGYVSPENLARLAGTPAVVATFFGPVVRRTDLPQGVRPRD